MSEQQVNEDKEVQTNLTAPIEKKRKMRSPSSIDPSKEETPVDELFSKLFSSMLSKEAEENKKDSGEEDSDEDSEEEDSEEEDSEQEDSEEEENQSIYKWASFYKVLESHINITNIMRDMIRNDKKC